LYNKKYMAKSTSRLYGFALKSETCKICSCIFYKTWCDRFRGNKYMHDAYDCSYFFM